MSQITDLASQPYADRTNEVPAVSHKPVATGLVEPVILTKQV